MVIHMGAQSNLHAAPARTLVNLLRHPVLLARVRAGDDPLLEQVANESIRMAQRSITLRYVMSPLDFDDGQRTYRLDLAGDDHHHAAADQHQRRPGLERFDPAHYEGRKLAPSVALPAKELVSTFGHGRHACPAQRFAISAIRIAVRALVDTYQLTPRFADVQPRRQQIGGVARAAHPCPIHYRRR
ncbi:MAG: hypothetical protein U0802_13485 [Candidatus Binatia bacterium]